MLSKLTLIGMHNYTKGAIWDNIMLPAGIDKDVLCNEILKQCGEFPLIYPDDEFLKAQIQMFFKKWYHNFERWYAAYTEEYNALYNVDVTSNITEHGVNEANSASEGSVSAGTSRNGASTTNTSGSGISNGNNSETTNRSKAAFDASTLQLTEQDSSTANTSLSTSETSSLSSSENASESSSSENSESMTSSSEHTITTDERKYGNQGVTMSQEMLLAEFNAWRFNLYSQIADIFASEFCVCIYV